MQFWTLRLLAFQTPGKVVAGVALLSSALSLTLSWPRMADTIEQAVIARRELHGLPLDPGQVQFMQTFFPAAASISLVFFAILLWQTWTLPDRKT